MNPVKVFSGITLISLGLTLYLISKAESVSFGGVVLIGPIPVVFGNSPDIMALAVIAIAAIIAISAMRW
ncbi:TIGR00304 family membrane protein [Geoglobus acetivorans]|uniref:DUF131 domain-containing protein n=1 Tax=Geoglobus acetivorans TaxID=565033 RepID=A0A0A7GI21_GEOAI|nr:hypothetical protein GACE_1572 [Geoglobus acetivorans]